MSWLKELKEDILYDTIEATDYQSMHGKDILRIIAIVEEAEWGSILCDDIPDPQCPICGGSKESGHGLVYETKRPCPYSDEWVKS